MVFELAAFDFDLVLAALGPGIFELGSAFQVYFADVGFSAFAEAFDFVVLLAFAGLQTSNGSLPPVASSISKLVASFFLKLPLELT